MAAATSSSVSMRKCSMRMLGSSLRTAAKRSSLICTATTSGWTETTASALTEKASPTTGRVAPPGNRSCVVTPTTWSPRPMSKSIVVMAGEKLTIRGCGASARGVCLRQDGQAAARAAATMPMMRRRLMVAVCDPGKLSAMVGPLGLSVKPRRGLRGYAVASWMAAGRCLQQVGGDE